MSVCVLFEFLPSFQAEAFFFKEIKTMNTLSAVEFATDTRIHVGIGVRDLERSVAFYSRLFNQEPTKVRPRYAKFEVAEPPVNLTLNEGLPDGVKSSVASHFGIQVKSTEAVTQMAERLQKEGLTPTMETGVTCCYAVQDKAWVNDPDGNEWEVFVVLDADAPEYVKDPADGCCAESACGCNA